MSNEETIEKDEQIKALKNIIASLENDLENARADLQKLSAMLSKSEEENTFLKGKVAAYEFVFTRGDTSI